jgi:hypothetical protein
MKMPLIKLPENGRIDNNLISRLNCEMAFKNHGLHGLKELISSKRELSILARDFLMQKEMDSIFFK